MKTPNRAFKDAIYEQFARIGKAVSSPKRLELLDLLCQGPRTVEILAKESSLTVANASQHLQVLRAARLVEAEKEGWHVTIKFLSMKFEERDREEKSRLKRVKVLLQRESIDG